MPGIVHINQPYWFGEGGDLTPAEFGLKCARELEAKILEVGAHRVAAFIGEPVQGAGGLVIPPETYWPEIQRIVDKYGILFVSDEVICGFGRTGQWFGCEHYGTRPDFMTMAKALSSGYLPIGGLMVGDRVANVLIDKGGEFFHGFTYSGHPAACAVAIANLEVFRRERIVERVREEAAPYLASRWRELGVSSFGRGGALPGPPGRDRAGCGQDFAPFLRAAGRSGAAHAGQLHAQRSRHARDARYVVRRAAFGHIAERN